MTFYFAKGYLGTAAQILPHFGDTRSWGKTGQHARGQEGEGKLL